METIRIEKDSLYKTEGEFSFDEERFVARLKEEDLELRWSEVTALNLVHYPYQNAKLFLEFGERRVLKEKSTRCFYFYFGLKDFSTLECFIKKNKLNQLPEPNKYMMEYPFVRVYSQHMRIGLNTLATILNVLLFCVLFSRLYLFIDAKTGGLSMLKQWFQSVGSSFRARVPKTSSVIELPFKPFVLIFHLLRIVVASLDDVSMGLVYFTSVVIFIYTYWTQAIAMLEFVLKMVLAGKNVLNAVRNKRAKKAEKKDD